MSEGAQEGQLVNDGPPAQFTLRSQFAIRPTSDNATSKIVVARLAVNGEPLSPTLTLVTTSPILNFRQSVQVFTPDFVTLNTGDYVSVVIDNTNSASFEVDWFTLWAEEFVGE